jgi:hypothetical protein
MNKIQTSYPIRGLSLITSCGCNLNCEYCWIAQSVNEHSHIMQKENIQALQDGTFIKNVSDVLYRLGQSPLSIDSIAFWGQEPTLTLHHITDHFEDWYNLFPNWRLCTFSTNTMAHLDRIIDFFDKIDNTVKNRFDLSIQFSYDGDYGTDNLRGASSSRIHDNLVEFFTKLNEKHYNHLDIRFNFHAVFSMGVMDKLNTPEDLIAYNDHLQKWGIEFYKMNKNKSVKMAPRVDMALENPVLASTAQGLKLHYLIQMMQKMDAYTLFKDNIDDVNDDRVRLNTFAEEITSTFETICNQIEQMLMERFPEFPCLSALLEAAGENPILRHEMFNEMNPMVFCGNGVGELKIRYDGMLVNCQNHMYETDPSYIKDDGSAKASIKKALASHNYFINPLTATDEEIKQYLYLFETSKEYCLEFLMKNNVTLMEFLLHNSQIDSSYADGMKKIKHALLCALTNCCSYNNQMTTGSLYLRHSGWLRLLCNGFIDDCLDKFNQSRGREVI